jgi:hypothetical protein
MKDHALGQRKRKARLLHDTGWIDWRPMIKPKKRKKKAPSNTAKKP